MDTTDYRTLPQRVQDILRKYHLISLNKMRNADGSAVRNPDGTIVKTEGYRSCNLLAPGSDGKPLGEGPLLDPDVISRFLEADATPDKHWFEWILVQTGGGDVAMKRSEVMLTTVKNRFIEERRMGYADERKVKHPPVDNAEANRLWDTHKQNFVTTISVGDQDLAIRGVFGFFRHWPGKDRIYEIVTDAVRQFQKMTKKIVTMNKTAKKDGSVEAVSLDPSAYQTFGDLQRATMRVNHFYASKQAVDDIRISPGIKGGEKTVYDDDFVTVIVPLTYRAAVRYGLENWDFSNQDTFKKALSNVSGAESNPWKSVTRNSVLVYIQFNVPMPGWVVFDGGHKRYSLNHLAMKIPHAEMKNLNIDDALLYDEENKSQTTMNAIKKRIYAEAENPYDPETEPYPVHKGKVFQNKQEAEEVVRHLDSALEAIKHWAARFDPRTVVSNYMDQ